MLTSAKTGDGIEKLFDTLTDKYLSPEFNPKIKELLRERGETKNLKPKDQKEIKNNKKKWKIKY